MPIKVLIVDDDPTILEMLTLVLPARGFTVSTVDVSQEAVKEIKQNGPDVIVLDLMMPDLDGWALCQQIREFSQVPILALSAVIDKARIERILAYGANEYLAKPVPLDTLVTRLENLADGSSST